MGILAPQQVGLTATQTNAWDQLANTLRQYGFAGKALTDLVAWAKREVISGAGTDQITSDLMQTPEFKQRFPAIGVLGAQGIAITPAEYISMEQSYAQAEKQAGIAPNFASYDQLIQNKVSPSEYSDRLTQGYLAVANADQNVINTFQQYYGVSKAQLAQFFLNPKVQEPLLLRQAVSAQIGGAAKDVGLGTVSQPEAMKLAQEGVTQQQAQQGFEQAAQQSQLFGQLPGQPQTYEFNKDNVAQAAVGLDATTQLQLQLRAQLEKNAFQGGVGEQSNQQGEVGAGSVQR